MNSQDKKSPKEDPKKEKNQNTEKDIEFGSEKGERTNSSNFTHSGNQLGGAGGEDNERDIISK
jgi:hypothetical protein